MEKDKQVEALKYLSQAHRAQFRERSRIEWRCVFTAISFFVLSVVAICKGDINFGKHPETILLILLASFIILAIIVIIYLAHINIAHNKDKELAERAEDAIRSIVQGEDDLPQNLLKFEKYWVSRVTLCSGKGKWGWLWESITISLFAIVSISLIFFKQC